jgi:hypothetical protein
MSDSLRKTVVSTAVKKIVSSSMNNAIGTPTEDSEILIIGIV